MTELLSLFSTTLSPYVGRQRWYIAFSGGLDSHVLLHLAWCLQQIALSRGDDFPELCAIHIDHQLQVDSASWSEKCRQLCDKYAIQIHVHKIDVQGRRQGTESLAREARYRVFEGYLADEDLLLLGHHQDDQAETFLLRLLRGAGVVGLAAIPAVRSLGRGSLFRPLLKIPRSTLETYAACHNLDWVDDPSNKDSHYSRNFLRHRVMSALSERWPEYRESISKAAELQAETAVLLNTYLDADVENCSDEKGRLDLNKVAKLDPVRRQAVLRHFVFLRLGIRLDRTQSREVASQFLDAAQDSQAVFRLRGGGVLRAFRRRLYCDKHGDLRHVSSDLVWDWDGESDLHVDGLGILSVTGNGDFLPRGKLTVRFRQGGERCRLSGHKHSKSLKKLLQECDIPPWERDCLPLIYCDDEIAAVANIAICDGFQANQNEKGLQLHWEFQALT
ncbi:tRNA lysidine(34) synthetase TilS [Zhongshania sp. BJYM1]|uniref:tRNA lysidine(34) synthetase TilS n=1 Tax=Zhongshania aquatica TaxID=2965069 RepID=UPI0022B2BD53|nr:tRNA lysidine(34) synthetase TilS [Marortus sp. BJYM1]